MLRPVRLLLLHLVLLVPDCPAGPTLVRKRATRTCSDLPEVVLEQMFGRLSVGVMSAFQHALQLEPRVQPNQSCPSRARSQTDGRTRLPANLLSISPWAYRISYDPNRYPRSIPEAYCLCKGCLLGPSRQESKQHRSAPVYAPSVVLKRTGSCVGGRHSYTELYVSVAVGCTCTPLMEEEGDGQQSLERLNSAGRKTWRTHS